MNHSYLNRSSLFSLWFSYGLLLVLGLCLFFPSYRWIFLQLVQSDHRFSQIALLVLSVFIVYQMTVSKRKLYFQITMNPLAAITLIASGSIFLFNEFYIAINIISAACAFLGSYALLGFFIEQASWKKGILYALIFILFLPFGDYLEVFLGFPLRLMSAQAASDLLVALGFELQNIQTLIELDNHLTYVDLSCSGIRGLWSGVGFFVLLTWIEQKTIGLRWCLVFVVFLLLIIAINILRITVMVLLEGMFHASQFADLVHNGLGIVGFAIACMCGWIMLSTLKTNTESKSNYQQSQKSLTAFSRPGIIASWSLVGTLIAFNALYTPMAKLRLDAPQITPVFTDRWHQRQIPLNAQEADFFPRQGAYAQKFTLNFDGQIPGSMVLVNTLYWKAHHDPKNCFQAQGYNLLDDRSRRFFDAQTSERDRPEQLVLRQLELSRGDKIYRVYYWFQSQDQQTADFSQRLFSGLLSRASKHQLPWTMVSLIVEQSTVLNSDNEQQLIQALSGLTTRWVAKLSESQLIAKEGKK